MEFVKSWTNWNFKAGEINQGILLYFMIDECENSWLLYIKYLHKVHVTYIHYMYLDNYW